MDRFFQVKTVEEALRILFSIGSPPEPPVENVHLTMCRGRVLGKDVTSGEDVPPYDRSTVDGYAVRAKDTFGASEPLPAILQVIEDIPMGGIPERGLLAGQTAQIPTGGLLPEGADACVMIEHTEILGDSTVLVSRPVSPGENVVQKGEDVSAGSLLLPKGSLLRSPDIGALAAIGMCSVPVYKKPVVAVVSGGDEIVPPEAPLGPGQMRDINSYSIAASVESAGGEPRILGIAEDTYDALRAKVQGGLSSADVIVVSGGSSVGTRDHTVRVFSDLGPPGVLVHGVAVRPGKPVIIGATGKTLLFGLPGHPVSALTAFSLFVRPAIEAMLGRLGPLRSGQQTSPPEATVTARLSRNVSSAPGRQDHIRVRLITRTDGVWAEPVLGKSGLITTMVRAHGEIVIPRKSEGLQKGTTVQVALYSV